MENIQHISFPVGLARIAKKPCVGNAKQNSQRSNMVVAAETGILIFAKLVVFRHVPFAVSLGQTNGKNIQYWRFPRGHVRHARNVTKTLLDIFHPQFCALCKRSMLREI